MTTAGDFLFPPPNFLLLLLQKQIIMKIRLMAVLFALSPVFLAGQINYPDTKENKSPLSLELSFTEDWSSGSFETNNWTVSSENWLVNTEEGNAKPSAEFRYTSTKGTSFSSVLESDYFGAENLFFGSIKLQFDLKNTGGNGLLIVSVFDGENWRQVGSTIGNEITNWKQYTADITNLIFGRDFKIRFKIQGTDSPDNVSWFIDNISVYRICDHPKNPEGSPYWESSTNRGIKLAWDAPEAAVNEWYNYINYDKSFIDTELGLLNGGDFSVAIRWDNHQLEDYKGDTLQAIRFFISDSGFSKVVAKIWTGENTVNQIFADTLQNPKYHSWNEISIDTTLILDPALEYWVGYRVLGQETGRNPAGCTDDYGFPGYSDQISFGESEDNWDYVSDLCCHYSWNIQLKLIDNDTSRNCLGYNILRKSPSEEEYSQIAFVENKEFMEECYFQDSTLQFSQQVCYKISASWGKDGDSCISNFATNTLDSTDYICIEYSGLEDDEINNETFIYPNPAKSTIHFKQGLKPTGVVIYNLNGQIVQSEKEPKNSINIPLLPKGIYVVEMKLKNQNVIREKLVVD